MARFQSLKAEAFLASFFEQLSKKGGALLLDYDGTLAPFRVDRLQAFPYEGIIPLLEQLMRSKKTQLEIITGRPLDEIEILLKMDPLPSLWGLHGWQHCSPEGSREEFPLPIVAGQQLQKAKELLNEEMRACCEDKGISLALHWRGLPVYKQAEMEEKGFALWKGIAAEGALQLLPFNGGIELRALGRDKGCVIREIVASIGKEKSIAYLGDDRTDEDAFAALQERGLKVLANREVPTYPTLADIQLIPPKELFLFLNRWLENG